MTDPVLDLQLDPSNDAGAATVREYLEKLLLTLWREGAFFEGKRPFGNSDWKSDLEIPLVNAGLVRGKIDEDGFLEDLDDEAAQKVIAAAIKRMCDD